MLTKEQKIEIINRHLQPEADDMFHLLKCVDDVVDAVIAKLAQGVSVERLKNIDWQQFAMHGGEPCFDLDRDGSLCGRARHWFGHNAPGSFVSLHDFTELQLAAARVQALEEAAKVCDRQAIPNAGFLAEKVRALINAELCGGTSATNAVLNGKT